MPRKFKLRTDIDYPIVNTEEGPSGRHYLTDFGALPSVTTILSTLPHPELDAWRERVGEEEAERVSEEAANIGTCMHNMLEAFVKGVPYTETGITEEAMAARMFRIVKTIGLSKLTEIWGIEVALYCYLYAGRTDLVGIYNKIPSIIDYKTSKWRKAKEEFIKNYKLQTAAYAIAHDEMFGDMGIRQGVLLIGIRPHPKYRIPPKIQKVIISKQELEECKLEWLEIVEDFYNNNNENNHDHNKKSPR